MPVEPTNHRIGEALSNEELASELASRIGAERGSSLLDLARANAEASAARPGAKTSEFQMAALGVAAGLIMVALGAWKKDHVSLLDQGLELVKWSVSAYAVSRGISKVRK